MTKTTTVSLQNAESDLQTFGSKTFDFETAEGPEGWQVIRGIFDRTDVDGGGNGTDWYLSSSDNVPDQCDQIKSPAIVLSGTSTLSLWNQYEIEAELSPGEWFDRANVGIFDIASGERAVVSPDSGRLYEASGPNGTCDTAGQPGWADVNATWGTSTWSSGALGVALGGPAGELVQLHIYYGTDPLDQGFGFHFDEVTLTDFDLQQPDAQSDICMEPSFVFSDGFESGDTTAWDSTVE